MKVLLSKKVRYSTGIVLFTLTLVLSITIFRNSESSYLESHTHEDHTQSEASDHNEPRLNSQSAHESTNKTAHDSTNKSNTELTIENHSITPNSDIAEVVDKSTLYSADNNISNRSEENLQTAQSELSVSAPELTTHYQDSSQHLDSNQYPGSKHIGNTEDDTPTLSIIIDDIGYNYPLGKRSLELDYPVTLAVIPFTPHAKALANEAAQRGIEVMIHAPMQAEQGHLIEDGLSVEMSYDAFHHALHNMIEALPNAVGLNNHGGSKMSQDHEKISWLMQELVKRDLYFVDSRTTAKTVTANHAQLHNVRFAERDIFIDNSRKPQDILVQLQKAQTIALKTGSAVAIGHPYPETLAVLEQELPNLHQAGIKLVYASAMTKTLPASNQLGQNSKTSGTQ